MRIELPSARHDEPARPVIEDRGGIRHPEICIVTADGRTSAPGQPT
jgi:hypothetical protein